MCFVDNMVINPLVPIVIFGDNIFLVWCVLLIMWLLDVYFLEKQT